MNPIPSPLRVSPPTLAILICLFPFMQLAGHGQDRVHPADPFPRPETREPAAAPQPDDPQSDEAGLAPGAPPLPALPDRSAAPSGDRPAPAQGITAMEAMRRLTERFGRDPFSLIIEMAGPDGQTQPDSWKVVVVDLSSPFLARTFSVDAHSVADEGENRTFYPDSIPAGFIALEKLAVGSYDAFIALDKEAGEAKIGFDSIQYRLRAREGSNEPVWTMTALDRDRYAVGIVDVSGATGRVLRTVWLRRSGARTLPVVEDSALKKALRN